MPSIAILGASNDHDKYGNKAVRAYLRRGWTVYPVTPHATTVEGLPTFPTIESIPGPIDRASLYVPPHVGLRLLPGIATKRVAELFVNPGAGSDALLTAAKNLGLSAVEACSIVAIGERP